MADHDQVPTLAETEATVRMLVSSTKTDPASVIAAKAKFLEMHANDAMLDGALVENGVAAYLAREARSFFANCLAEHADIGEIAEGMLLAGKSRRDILAAFAEANRTPQSAHYAIASAHKRCCAAA